jgi:hypothetical protein
MTVGGIQQVKYPMLCMDKFCLTGGYFFLLGLTASLVSGASITNADQGPLHQKDDMMSPKCDRMNAYKVECNRTIELHQLVEDTEGILFCRR